MVNYPALRLVLALKLFGEGAFHFDYLGIVLFSFKLSPHRIQILSLVDDAIIFLLSHFYILLKLKKTKLLEKLR